MLVDVHAHLDFPQFDGDRDRVIDKAAGEGITIINSGLGSRGIKKTLGLSEKHGNVHACLGLAPTEFDEKEIDETIKLIRENRGRIVGIGEVGLDHYWIKDEWKRALQKDNLKRFIALSRELNLPLVIHSREAEKDALEMLEKERVKALLHCFGGGREEAVSAAESGHLISMPTSIAHSKQKQELAKALPLESMVLETDAPYLAPTPKTRNEPVNIRLSAKKISELKGIPESVVEEKTTANAKRFFNLP